MRLKQYKIELEIYEAFLTVILAEDIHAAKKHLFKKKNWYLAEADEEISQAMFLYDEPDTKRYVVILSPNASPGTVAHEVTHVAKRLLTTCDVDIMNNEEPLSYMIGFLVDKIWGKMHPKPKAVKKKMEIVENDNCTNKDTP